MSLGEHRREPQPWGLPPAALTMRNSFYIARLRSWARRRNHRSTVCASGNRFCSLIIALSNLSLANRHVSFVTMTKTRGDTFADRSLRRRAALRASGALVALLPGAAFAHNGQTSVCTITGTARAGHTPLPGVVLSVTSADDQTLDLGSSGRDGSYTMKVPGPGRYTLKGDLVAFAPGSREFVIDETTCHSRVDLEMALASRARVLTAATDSTAPSQSAGSPQASSNPLGSSGMQAGRVRAGGQGGPSWQRLRQFQSLALLADQAGLAHEDIGGTVTESAAQALLPPGFSSETSSESVTALGSPQGSESFLGPGGDRRQKLKDTSGGGSEGGPFGAFNGQGPGGVGGLGAFTVRGRPGIRERGNQLHGSLFHSFATSGLDSAPFPINGQATQKPSYFQQHFGVTVGGPLAIPKSMDASARTFLFFNYNGARQSSPYDQYSNVPTQAERAGDLSALPTVVSDPTTRQPFPGNQIPGARIDPAAQRLLNLIPLPNQPGPKQNFHNVSTTINQVDDINLRVVHNYMSTQSLRRGRGGRGGGGRVSSNLNIGIHYRHSDSTLQNPFPALGGTSRSYAWDAPIGYAFTKNGFFNSFRFQSHRQHSEITNRYAFNLNIAGQAGLLGVSNDPFDWGAPTISLSTFESIRDVNPSMRIDQTISIGDQAVRTHGKHTFRLGGDYRDIRFTSRSDASARGIYLFTGAFSGLDFADFLLGWPQQATLQYITAGPEQFRSRSWDLFLQDDWRVAERLTVNAGVRYEYYSPSSEVDNHLITLDANSDFTSAAPIVAGGTSPFFGALPDTIVRPFRGGIAPRVGIAWTLEPSTIIRTGYGINYSNGVYQNIAQQLANQPPFAVANTVLATPASPVPLESALLNVGSGLQNTYGVDPNYRLGLVEIWNLDIQHDLTRTLTMGIGYTGTRGSHLDMLRQPNRGPDGLRIAGVQPFIWESSGATSILQSVSFRLRKRLTRGFAAGGVYTWAKSIDDASSIGGDGSVVAQNDQKLTAERGLSSFDQRHRLLGDVTFELPFGPNKKWFNEGPSATLLGGWVLNGNMQFESGMPFTARVLNNRGDVARGTNGTLRANYDGSPIAIADPTTMLYFNTSAFSIPPSGTFGNAGRNTIVGPGISNVNIGVTRNINFAEHRGLSIQILANNIFNTVQFASIDAVVNSPTFGRVTAARAMRRVQILSRFRF
jgi:TonB-dependent receptor-like protein